MPTAITLIEGKPAIEIEDARGKLWTYLVTHSRVGQVLGFTLSKLGSIHDEQYTVTRRPGAWECSCKAFLYRRRLNRDDCKHVVCCRDVAAFLGLEEQPHA